MGKGGILQFIANIGFVSRLYGLKKSDEGADTDLMSKFYLP